MKRNANMQAMAKGKGLFRSKKKSKDNDNGDDNSSHPTSQDPPKREEAAEPEPPAPSPKPKRGDPSPAALVSATLFPSPPWLLCVSSYSLELYPGPNFLIECMPIAYFSHSVLWSLGRGVVVEYNPTTSKAHRPMPLPLPPASTHAPSYRLRPPSPPSVGM